MAIQTTELGSLIRGLAATHPHDGNMWAVLNDFRGDRGEEPLTLDEITDLICDHTEADGPRYLYAETLDTLPEWEECKNCEGKKTGKRFMRAVGWYRGKSGPSKVISTCPTCEGSGRVPTSHRARAEFIRLQLQLAAGADWRLQLGGRSGLLLSQHGEEWFGCGTRMQWAITDERTQYQGLFVQRGWPFEARLPLADFLANADALCRVPLTTIRVTCREPEAFSDRFIWRTSASNADLIARNSDEIPYSFLPFMGMDQVSAGDYHRWGYPTPELAHAALAKACLQWLTQRRKQLRSA